MITTWLQLGYVLKDHKQLSPIDWKVVSDSLIASERFAETSKPIVRWTEVARRTSSRFNESLENVSGGYFGGNSVVGQVLDTCHFSR